MTHFLKTSETPQTALSIGYHVSKHTSLGWYINLFSQEQKDQDIEVKNLLITNQPGYKDKNGYLGLNFGVLVHDGWVVLLWSFGEQHIMVGVHDKVDTLLSSCEAKGRKRPGAHSPPRHVPGDLKAPCL